ncbi:bifunctional anthranilate synthase component I family protein/class IV aminotransferase [Baekduia soli]|uniref:bifunctional anthranilate synthase component I family protein/class IV aminotransferase n=1 Tax=Baekduia soli TaxID=496014 RepID=UPI001E3340FC|nr:bifunctional anthranilate synthase component I family protein/class IV aminotransferase [Baekduia soli]
MVRALWTDERSAQLEQRLQTLGDRLRAGVGAPRRVRTGRWSATPSAAGHARAVEACRERIAAGDLFQANLALRLRATVYEGRPADMFARGVEALAPDRAAFVGDGDRAVASLSPELFVTRRGDEVATAPIKGTRPRRSDPGDDAAQRAALRASAKDRAENVMIVDLMRNDLGRVCTPGTVRVGALAEVRPHAGVWHLVSEVSGRRRAGTGDAELVRAMFPPGSVTGAPKLAAMDVISALESTERQAFCGAIGLASPVAGLELSVAIRTFEFDGPHAWLDVGGGVVADSDPAEEAAECLAKARPLLAALGAGPPAAVAVRDGTVGDAAAVPVPPRLGARPRRRPDPAAGVFETLLVRDGIAVAARRHLARLAASAEALYGLALPSGLAALVDHAAVEHGGPCRLRVRLAADGAVALEAGPLPSPAGPLVLEPVCLPGGIGAHKWQDRRLLEGLEAVALPATVLLVDLDGLVLETARSCMFAVRDDELVTPPLDGRILPGVTRARVLEAARAAGVAASERPLHLDELRHSDAAFAVNALRGVQPVAAVDGTHLGRPGDRVRTVIERYPQLW